LTIKVSGIKNVLRKIEAAKRDAVQDAEKSVKNKMLAALREATPKDTGEAAAGWQIQGESIVNNVDHVLLLNRGSSTQAPSHFIERTVLSEPRVRPNGVIVSEKQ